MGNEFVVIAKFVAKPDKVDDLHRTLHSLIEPTRQESGCLNYELHQSSSDPKTFTMIEKFINKAAGDFHVSQPYLQVFLAKLPELIENSTVDFYRVADLP